MLVKHRKQCYKANRKYVQGRGFVDFLTSSLKSIGSYVSQNKDLIAKPLLGAVGNLSATALEEGAKALVKRAINKKNNQNTPIATGDLRFPHEMDAKAQQILDNILNGFEVSDSSRPSNIPVANIIGSGIKKF